MRISAVALAGLLVLGACQSNGFGDNRATYGTGLGAVAGGVLGAVIAGDDNRWLGGILGAAIGGAIGNRVGNHLDREDERAIADSTGRSLETGETVTWSNPENNTSGWSSSGASQPRATTSSNGQTVETECKPYTATVRVGEETATQTGTACRNPSTGAWEVVG